MASAAAAPGSQAGVKPRSNFVNRETFRLICKAQKICERFRFASTCKYLREYNNNNNNNNKSVCPAPSKYKKSHVDGFV